MPVVQLVVLLVLRWQSESSVDLRLGRGRGVAGFDLRAQLSVTHSNFRLETPPKRGVWGAPAPQKNVQTMDLWCSGETVRFQVYFRPPPVCYVRH